MLNAFRVLSRPSQPPAKERLLLPHVTKEEAEAASVKYLTKVTEAAMCRLVRAPVLLTSRRPHLNLFPFCQRLSQLHAQNALLCLLTPPAHLVYCLFKHSPQPNLDCIFWCLFPYYEVRAAQPGPLHITGAETPFTAVARCSAMTIPSSGVRFHTSQTFL